MCIVLSIQCAVIEISSWTTGEGVCGTHLDHKEYVVYLFAKVVGPPCIMWMCGVFECWMLKALAFVTCSVFPGVG